MHSIVHGRYAASCPPDDGVQIHQRLRRQHDVDQDTAQHCSFFMPLDSHLMTMEDISIPTNGDFDIHMMQSTLPSCHFPVEQRRGGISNVNPSDLCLGLDECDFYNDTHFSQGCLFPQSGELGTHDCTMASDPSVTFQHCMSPTPVEIFPSHGLMNVNDELSFYTTPFNTAPMVHPVSGYQESNFLSDFENSSENHSTPLSTINEEDETDKPYARLIYDALINAPGNRMMLREIYDWFLKHTTKPQDSGSNGWQNSIRHNLSMNQAFENDKSEPSTKGYPRKANSVWILTKEAIQNGVQSTTRYRKTGTGKRVAHRMPAPQRQKSGAKGGRAARRSAARLRKDEGKYRATQQASSQLDLTPFQSPRVTCYDGSPDQGSICSYQPLTPANEDQLTPFYDQPPAPYSFHWSPVPVKMEHDNAFGEDMWTKDPPIHSDVEYGWDELCKWESD